MTLSDFPQIQALPAREKLQLVDELWKAVSGELDSLAVCQEEKELLDARWTAFLKDPASALTLEQFRERMNVLRA